MYIFTYIYMQNYTVTADTRRKTINGSRQFLHNAYIVVETFRWVI